MIPKIIHYCWFGGNPLPPLALRCIESWRRLCPDYEIVEWNERNFNIDAIPYAREAYDAGKYAFVSDVARLHALAAVGGIYLDTDVELLRPLDGFLQHVAFTGFETDRYLTSGVIGGERGCRYAVENLRSYYNRRFIRSDGSLDTTANTVTLTDYILPRGLRLDDSLQELPGLLTVYPRSYFCPTKNLIFGYRHLPAQTVAIHYFTGSWQLRSTPEYVRLRKKFRWIPYFIRKKLILAMLGVNRRGLFPALLRTVNYPIPESHGDVS